MNFYHGSVTEGLKELIPFYKQGQSHLSKPYVYLTTSRHLALHYIWDSKRCPWKMPMLDIRENDCLVFQEMFPNALEYFYKGLRGYIYRCEGNYEISKQVGVATCAISETPVPVADCEMIEDVSKEIWSYAQKGLFIYERYETLPPERIQRIHDIVRKNIIERGNLLLSPQSEMSQFVREKFPKIWEDAVSGK